MTAIDADAAEAAELARLLAAMDSLNATAMALSGGTVLDPSLWRLDDTFVTVDRLADADLTVDSSSLSVAFEPFSGPCGDSCLHSTVACLGTQKYLCDVVAAKPLDEGPLPTVGQVSFDGAPLRSGVRYFATVAARSHGGLVSLASTDGILLDLEAPGAGWVLDTVAASVASSAASLPPVEDSSTDVDCIGVTTAANGTGVSASWGGFRDAASPLFPGSTIGPNAVARDGYPALEAAGLSEYWWSLGSAPLLDDVLPWSPVGLATTQSDSASISAALADGRLRIGDAVFASVRGVDRAGHISEASSDGVRVICDSEAVAAGSWGCGAPGTWSEEADAQLSWEGGDFICFSADLPATRSSLSVNASSTSVQLAVDALVFGSDLDDGSTDGGIGDDEERDGLHVDSDGLLGALSSSLL